MTSAPEGATHAQVSIRMSREDFERITAAAKADDRPRAAFIRRAALRLAEEHERRQQDGSGR